jgi:type I restriction enzyme S subunit
MNEWKIENINELVSYIAKGITPSYATTESQSTVRVLNQKCNRDFKIDFTDSRLHDISKKKIPLEKFLQHNDIIINSTGIGTAGRVAQLNKVSFPTIVDSHMIVLRANEKIDPIYLGYVLKLYQPDIMTLDEGSTGQTELNRERLLTEITVRYPVAIMQQKAIASVLSSLDDKIDLLHRQNKTLEAMAEALFKQWFVVEAKDDWALNKISDIAYINNKMLSPKSFPAKYFTLYSIPAFDNAKNPIQCLGSEIQSNKNLILSNSILISKLNPIIPRIWFIHSINNDNAISSTEFINIIPLRPEYLSFLYFVLKLNITELSHYTSGTSGSHQRLDPKEIMNLTFYSPPLQKISNFNLYSDNILLKININLIQTRILTKIRDLTLPQLINGEVKLKI